jgi:hypothetical protein
VMCVRPPETSGSRVVSGIMWLRAVCDQLELSEELLKGEG